MNRKRSLGFSYRAIRFLYQENDARVGALGDLDLVAGFADQIRNIDHRQRIGAQHFQPVAGYQRLQRLARLQGWQRAFQAGEIEFCGGHEFNMAKPVRSVN